MQIRRGSGIRASEITDERLYVNRRVFLKTVGVGAASATLVPGLGGVSAALAQEALPPAKKSAFSASEPLNSWEDVTGYNNFYEFGTDKEDPKRNAGRLKVKPWTVKVDGLVNKPADYAIDDLINLNQLEERVYRLRCVEAWSMVIPWVGFPLAEVITSVDTQNRPFRRGYPPTPGRQRRPIRGNCPPTPDRSSRSQRGRRARVRARRTARRSSTRSAWAETRWRSGRTWSTTTVSPRATRA